MKKTLAAAFLGIAASAFAHDEPPRPAQHEHGQHQHGQPGAAAVGIPADPAGAARTVHVAMSDTMRFDPAEISVKQGESVRFVVKNVGQVPHEFVLGTLEDLKAHAEHMRANPHMEHSEPNAVRAAPGQAGEIGWRFTQAGTFYYGCLEPGHFEAGMVGRVVVTAVPGSEHEHQHDAADHAEGHAAHTMEMSGAYGSYPMAREASGTAWQPDSSPHEGVMAMTGDWHWMMHGYANAVHDRQNGPRGDTKTVSESMFMLMGQRPTEHGVVGIRVMTSLDPLMGKDGYPLLFQTGETADGRTPLVDRQHPHNLFMELAASYSHRVTEHDSVFVYGGLPGEPALGPAAFMHRFSGVDNPEAPLTHHWMDSTHITNGVVTLGYVRDRLKLEASAFHGREPDQNRYRIEPGRLDSASARATLNVGDDWSFQVSHGFIKSPEALEPDTDVRRTTASATWNKPLDAGNWQTTFAWGRNRRHGDALDGYLAESALSRGADTFFGRVEHVAKDELFDDSSPLHGRAFTVKKLSLGYLRDFRLSSSLKLGVGAMGSIHSIPAALEPAYGSRPTSFLFFVRLKMG